MIGRKPQMSEHQVEALRAELDIVCDILKKKRMTSMEKTLAEGMLRKWHHRLGEYAG